MYKITDVAHDGNCFYSAVALLLGLGAREYNGVKQQLSKYFLEHQKDYEGWGYTPKLAEKISKEGVYAGFRVFRIAADCLQQPIHLYQHVFPSSKPEIFDMKNPSDAQPLRILFVG